VVILVHGYTGMGHAMGCFAQYYHEKNDFNVLMPDCRGHGDAYWKDMEGYMAQVKKFIDKHIVE
jgi:esterase/lipase